MPFKKLPIKTNNGGTITTCPFDIKLSSESFTINPGLVNGYLPSNIFTSFQYAKTGTVYIIIHCVTDGMTVTDATIQVNSSPPAQMKHSINVGPSSFDVLIYVLVNSFPFRVWPCKNVNANISETARTLVSSPSPGEPFYNYNYTWNLS